MSTTFTIGIHLALFMSEKVDSNALDDRDVFSQPRATTFDFCIGFSVPIDNSVS